MANRVKLELNEKFFKELTVTGEDGTERTVWRVSIPSGTKVNGIELSGASFLSNYAKDSTSKPNYKSVSFKEGQQVFLSVPGTNGQGEREYAKLGFKVEDLIAGIQEQRFLCSKYQEHVDFLKVLRLADRKDISRQFIAFEPVISVQNIVFFILAVIGSRLRCFPLHDTAC